MNLDFLLQQALVYDIETSAEYSNGKEVNIKTNFDDYLSHAKCKFFGAYSYKDKKEYYLEVRENIPLIKKLLSEHSILIGFNSEDFDYPILKNNALIDEFKKPNHVDCMKILGSGTFRDRQGYKFKDRGALMGWKFKKNSLQHIAEKMELEVQKSDIDYKIFKKDTYTNEEKEEIIKYLKNDVMATKGMFDKLWNYWMPFTDLVDYKNICNLSWIKGTIASLIYKSACHSINTEPTYSENKSSFEEMGGRVLDPKYEEVKDVWYVDFASLYPHIFCMFNLFAEVEEGTTGDIWHGNELFKVRGHYDISYHHRLSKVVKEKLKERAELKKNDSKNPMIYTLKIWLNGLYGVTRSSIFEKVHTPNCGWDCCWLGQQIQEFTQKELENYGFEAVYGDTDSIMIRGTKPCHNDRDYIKICLKKIVKKILDSVPFPVDTYKIDIEDFLNYMLFPFSEQPIVDPETGKNLKKGNRLIKERKGKKKNYCFVYEKDGKTDVKLVGLPLKKDNATPLGIKIFNEVLKPLILEKKRAKFTKEFIDKQISKYLEDKEIMKLLAVEYKVNPAESYKKESQIHAQISKQYFNGDSGVISLIKNNKLGEVGKGNKYCSVKEAIEANLTTEDLVLEKLHNELEPFVLYEEKLDTKLKK